jgi:hypothetical protein
MSDRYNHSNAVRCKLTIFSLPVWINSHPASVPTTYDVPPPPNLRGAIHYAPQDTATTAHSLLNEGTRGHTEELQSFKLDFASVRGSVTISERYKEHASLSYLLLETLCASARPQGGA